MFWFIEYHAKIIGLQGVILVPTVIVDDTRPGDGPH